MKTVDKVYGRNAALAVLTRRIEDVQRMAYGASMIPVLGPYLKEAARRRIAYEERSDEDLERIAGSVHHEGICLALRKERPLTETDVVARSHGSRIAWVVLDGVVNPHNVGAIVRTAAFLGVDGLIVRGDPDKPSLTPAAVRIAEGGAEHLMRAVVRDLPGLLAALQRRGVRVVGTDMHATHDARRYAFPSKVAVVFGSEGHGMRDDVRAIVDDNVAIHGAGALDSLNVSVSAGIVLGALTASRIV